MDPPVLHSLVRELASSERFAAWTDAFPASARVSEPALPLVVATLWEHVGRALVLVLPDDGDARDVAEAASWFVGGDDVALLPSRGVGWDSGLADRKSTRLNSSHANISYAVF